MFIEIDKNKAPGATDAFKAIGKAFAVLSDTQKRKHYDSYGPEAFDTGASASSRHSTSNMRRNSYTYYTNSNNNQYWSDEDFSAEDIFNMFFGSGFTNQAAANRHRAHFNQHNNNQSNFVHTQSVSFSLTSNLISFFFIHLFYFRIITLYYFN